MLDGRTLDSYIRNIKQPYSPMRWYDIAEPSRGGNPIISLAYNVRMVDSRNEQHRTWISSMPHAEAGVSDSGLHRCEAGVL